MKAYWDSSALVEVILDRTQDVAAFNAAHERITRAHTLAEVFSTLTGGRLRDEHGEAFRLDPGDAAKAIASLAARMEIISLSDAETLRALRLARKKGVRGGHIHDWMHVVAAESARVDKIYTYNAAHFEPLTEVEIIEP